MLSFISFECPFALGRIRPNNIQRERQFTAALGGLFKEEQQIWTLQGPPVPTQNQQKNMKNQGPHSEDKIPQKKSTEKKMCWLCPAPGRGRTPSQGPWDLVGRGAARDRTTYPSLSPFFGLIFLLISGAGLGAWVGVAGCSRCRFYSRSSIATNQGDGKTNFLVKQTRNGWLILMGINRFVAQGLPHGANK